MKEAVKPINRYYLNPQTGVAFTVQKGQIIRVIDAAGGQVSDLVCFARQDIEEYLSSGRTIDYNPYSGTFFKKSLNYKGSQDLVKICSRRIKWC